MGIEGSFSQDMGYFACNQRKSTSFYRKTAHSNAQIAHENEM